MAIRWKKFLPLILLVTLVSPSALANGWSVDESILEHAQGSKAGGRTEGADSPLSEIDRLKRTHVLSGLHQCNLLDVRLGEMAVQKGNSEKVRRLGERMIRDFRFANNLISDFAEDNEVEILSDVQMIRGEDQLLASLQNLSEKEFDHEFLVTQRRLQAATTDVLIRIKSMVSEDLRLQQLLSKLIPIMEEHRQVSENLLRGLEGEGTI